MSVSTAHKFMLKLINSGINNRRTAANMAASVYNGISPSSLLKFRVPVKPPLDSEIDFYLSMFIQTNSPLAKHWLHKHIHFLSSLRKKTFKSALRSSSLSNKLKLLKT